MAVELGSDVSHVSFGLTFVDLVWSYCYGHFYVRWYGHVMRLILPRDLEIHCLFWYGESNMEGVLLNYRT